MGAFYGSVQVRCATRETLLEVLEDLSAKKKTRFWLGPVLGSWTGVYPMLHGLDPSIARDLARRLGGELFYLVVHDDDVFAYEYYRDGKRVDQYCSRPDYLGKPTAAAAKAVRGQPKKFAHLTADSKSFAQFENRIAEQADRPAVFASELLIGLAAALGMANVQTSYEYLSDGETDVEGWDQFLHVPDLGTEQARSRQSDAAHQNEIRSLTREGLLLAERGGHRGRNVPFLHWCPALAGAGFLLVAEPPEFTTREPVPLERIGPPWSAGPKPTGLMIDPNVKELVSSPTGRYAAVWCANSDPTASAWDTVDVRCVAKLAHSAHPAHHVAFSPDESAIICSCGGMQAGQISIVSLESGDPSSISYPLNVRLCVAHPNGRVVAVVDARNRLSVLDLPSGQIQRTLFIGGVRVPLELLLLLGNNYPSDWFTIPLDTIEDLLGRKRDEVAETLSKRLQRDAHEALLAARKPGWLDQKARSRESLNQLAFDLTGEHLFAATEGGLRVYRWCEILEANTETPPPLFAVDADKLVHETADGYVSIGGGVAAFAHDPDRDWLLFGGADGRVRFLDLADGQTGTLLEPPGLRPIKQLAFSRDRTVLGVACGTNMIEDGSARPMRCSAAVQFWNYGCSVTVWDGIIQPIREQPVESRERDRKRGHGVQPSERTQRRRRCFNRRTLGRAAQRPPRSLTVRYPPADCSRTGTPVGPPRGSPRDLGKGFTRREVWILHPLVRLKRADGLLVGPSAAQQGSRDREVGREGSRHHALQSQVGHARPGIEHMRDVVARQDLEILGLEVLAIADLDGIAEPGRQRGEKWVEAIQEVIERRKRRLVERAELEDQWANLLRVRLQLLREVKRERHRVEKVLIRQSSPASIAGVCRPDGNRDVLRDLEGKNEGLRCRVEQPLPVFLGRELIERKIPAHCRKRFGVLGQAGVVEFLLGELAPCLVALGAIDRPQPALVLPGTRAEVDTLGGQGPKLGGQPFGLRWSFRGEEFHSFDCRMLADVKPESSRLAAQLGLSQSGAIRSIGSGLDGKQRAAPASPKEGVGRGALAHAYGLFHTSPKRQRGGWSAGNPRWRFLMLRSFKNAPLGRKQVSPGQRPGTTGIPGLTLP